MYKAQRKNITYVTHQGITQLKAMTDVNNIIITWDSPPASTLDTMGVDGDMMIDNSYIYFKTAVGWKRATLSVF